MSNNEKLLWELVTQATKVLAKHAPPEGLTDKQAMVKFYAIFDGPVCNSLLAKQGYI